MQFRVPQNIDIEDKIIGSLTLIQFSYLLVAGALCYIFFKAFSRPLFILVSFPVVIVAICFAFVKIQEQTFVRFLKNLFLYLGKPKQRMWHKGPAALAMEEVKEEKPKEKETPPAKKVYKTQLEKLSQILDTSGKIPVGKQ